MKRGYLATIQARRRSASAVNSRCVPALGSSRGSLHFVPLCTQTEHLLLAVYTLLTGAATFCSPRLLFRSRLIKLPYECRVSGANDYVN